MRTDLVSGTIQARLATERRLDGAEKRGTGTREVPGADTLGDRYESRSDRAEAAKKAAANPRRSIRADLASLARSVRFTLRAALRGLGRELDRQEFAEAKEAVKGLYKEFRTDLREAFRGAREGGDRERFLEDVEGALDRLSAGLAEVFERSAGPETPDVPAGPVAQRVAPGGARELVSAADAAAADSSGGPDSLLGRLQRRFEVLYRQFRDRILPEGGVGAGDAPSFSRADGSVGAAIRAYEGG